MVTSHWVTRNPRLCLARLRRSAACASSNTMGNRVSHRNWLPCRRIMLVLQMRRSPNSQEPRSASTDAFIPSAETTKVAADLELATVIGTQIVMPTRSGCCAEPHTGKHVEVLLCFDSLEYRSHQVRRHLFLMLFPRFKRRNRSPHATSAAVVARFNDR